MVGVADDVCYGLSSLVISVTVYTCECHKVEWAFTSPMKTESGVFVMRVQCSV